MARADSGSIGHRNSSQFRQIQADQNRSYEVRLVDGLLEGPCEHLTRELRGKKSLIVTTPTVERLYARRLEEQIATVSDTSMLVLPVREETKQMDYVLEICRRAQQLDFERKSVLVGIGGGVCTDLVTMAASLLRRGTPYIRIPTTLLGQVDGSIGVKGAVNFNGRKNSLGCYYSASLVLVDPAFLSTLSCAQVSHGLAEIIKIAVVRDARLFELLEQYGPRLLESRFQSPHQPATEIIARSIMGIIEELESNMYEDRTYQRLVDFGHTLSPSIESAADFMIPHGEAVATSIAWCSQLAVELGSLDTLSAQRVLQCLRKCDLPVASELLTTDRVLHAMYEATRHRNGRLNLVIPNAIGSARFIETIEEIPKSAIESVQTLCRSLLPAQACDPPETVENRTAIRVKVSQGPCLVFDIGGTNLRAAIYDAVTKKLTRRAALPTPNHRRHPDLSQADILGLVIQRMDDLAESLLEGIPPSHAAIAFAGPLDERNQVTAAPTIWGGNRCAQPVDLLADLQCLWPSPMISLMNDVTAAGYRYLRSKSESLCVLTVGSGIGNKIFVNGVPFTGPRGRGGEIGHIVVDHDPDAIVCDCGGRGHLGAIASGRGTLATAKRRASRDPDGFRKSMLASLTDAENLTNEQLVQCFHARDPWSLQVIEYVAGKLANVLAQIHQSLGIERFVLMGGFCTALGEPYRRMLVESARSQCWDSGQDWNGMIEIGAADDDSGLLGAGRFACEFTPRNPAAAQ